MTGRFQIVALTLVFLGLCHGAWIHWRIWGSGESKETRKFAGRIVPTILTLVVAPIVGWKIPGRLRWVGRLGSIIYCGAVVALILLFLDFWLQGRYALTEAVATFEAVDMSDLPVDHRDYLRKAIARLKDDLALVKKPTTMGRAKELLELWDVYSRDGRLDLGEYIRWMVLFELRESLDYQQFKKKKEQVSGPWEIH